MDDRYRPDDDNEPKREISRETTIGSKEKLAAQRQRLPIFAYKDDIIKTVKEHQLLIIVGETGSGKSTQIAQYLEEEGYGKNGVIGITQPRRVGAVSLARRVAEETGSEVGDKVGYAVRFTDKTSRNTTIKYMTDGTLLRECLLDPKLSNYSVLILDEAHERSVHTDILFGLMKVTIEKRPDLKVLITSATLDDEKFSKFFGNCPIFFVPGRSYPVDVFYYEKKKKHENDHVEAALDCVMHIHQNEKPGDILVFLTGQQEIEDACNRLQKRMDEVWQKLDEEGSEKDYQDLAILPLYAALPPQDQIRVFEPAPVDTRKVVFATNIAETSLTVDGIVYVVDPGYVKQKMFNPTTGMEALQVTLISKVAAQQRAGRAGRTRPGKCYRLYTHVQYGQMDDVTIPEIQRSNLSNIVLSLKALGIHDVVGFPFLDPPDPFLLVQAVKHLYMLGALDEEGRLTETGKTMSAFPLDPSFSRMILGSVELKCSEDMLSLISMMSVENLFYRPSGKKAHDACEEKRLELYQLADKSSTSELAGDHVLLLYMYNTWKKYHSSPKWCRDYYIQPKGMEEADDIRKQLEDIMRQQKLDILSTSRDSGIKFDRLAAAMCTGLFMNYARKTAAPPKKADGPQTSNRDYRYLLVKQGQIASLHPMSIVVTSDKPVPFSVVYVEYVTTTRPFLRTVIGVKYEWVDQQQQKVAKVDVSKLIGRDVKTIIAESLVPQLQEPAKSAEFKEEKSLVEEAFARKTSDNAVEEAKKRFAERRKAMQQVSNPLIKKKKTD